MVSMAKKTTVPKPLNAIAWLGTAFIIVSYGLLSLGLLPNVLLYHILNLIGSAAVAAISYKRRVWQPFTVNVCFAIFATIAIIRALA